MSNGIKLSSIQSLKQELIASYSLYIEIHPVTSMCISPDSNFLVTGSSFGTITKWDLKTLLQLSCIPSFQSRVSSLSISNNQKFMISLSYYADYILWNFPENIEYTRISVHNKNVQSALFTENSEFIVSSDVDTIRVWSTYDRTQLALMFSDDEIIYCIAVSKDDRYIISGHENGTIIVWILSLYTEEFRLKNDSEAVTTLITMHGVILLP